MGIGDWGLGIGTNPQYPITKSPIPIPHNNENNTVLTLHYKTL